MRSAVQQDRQPDWHWLPTPHEFRLPTPHQFRLPTPRQLHALPGSFLPCRPRRQTLLFSATMPRRVERLAADALTSPIRITVGEVGAANEDIKQAGGGGGGGGGGAF